jgi:hypothetical protein
MHSPLARLLCRVMIIATFMLPFQSGQAAMIGTEPAIAAASVQADRDAVVNFLSRAGTVSQMQAMGVDSQSAIDRVAAMTDAEVGTLAGKIATAPAGADGGSLALLVLVVFFIWYFAFRR